MIALALLRLQESLAAEVIELDAFSWIFMLVMMGATTALVIWCFWRILSQGPPSDPDGVGSSHPPVPGRVEQQNSQP